VAQPVFFYDFSSPYAYLAAHRVDGLLAVPPRWQPIAYGLLIREIDKVPWSMSAGAEREEQMRECERRAAALALPLRWPRGWPVETYSLAALRAALVAEEAGRLREYSLAAYRQSFGLARDLSDIEVVLDAAREADVDRTAVREGLERADIKERLRRATEDALRRGVTGIPTVAVDGTLYWGEDRLVDAAAALGHTGPA
jgi:2-hydroxychromene-2-carboxylate isomerase